MMGTATEADSSTILRDFVIENFLFGDEAMALKDADSFLDTGVIDSTGILELITFIEDTFGLEVADEEMVPQNLDSIDNVVQFIRRKQSR